MLRLPLIFVLLLTLSFTPAYAAKTPNVVVSIAPVHSLVAGVMEGVAEPELLVSGNKSPHSYQLRPSQVRLLQRADIVVWVGEGIESFLPRTLATLGKDTRIIELMDVPGMKLLPTRRGGVWGESGEHHHGHSEKDGHLWLDPDNARVIVDRMVAVLGQLDASHAYIYRANGARLQQQLIELDRVLQQTLAEVHKTPYLVFHDAYQYFEQRYQLNPVGAIMVDPEHKPGARRIREIHEQLQKQNVHCVFSEPQFSERLLQVVTEGMRLKSATLDPMGVDLRPGKELYFDLMHRLGQGLAECLGSDS
jgi:zinc transport system substrate-binding protein